MQLNKKRIRQSLALVAFGFAGQALAQSAVPLQGATPPRPLESNPAAVPALPRPGQAPAVAKGGPTVQLTSIEVKGNTSISTEALLGSLGEVTGKSYDLAGLTELAARMQTFYRASGYPFAQVYLPPQPLTGGKLQVQVLEARYAAIRSAGKDELAGGAQPFLDYGLKSGDPIGNKALERTLLIIDDQPGIGITPVLSPGPKQGDSDLTVNVDRRSFVSGDIGFDNIGAPTTGEYRLRGLLNVDSPFRFGDRIALNLLTTNEQMWLGSVDYDAPIGGSGLRGSVGYAYTNYQLGRQFASLDAVGYAKIATARLSYPLVRSQATNALLSVGIQNKQLKDEYRSVSVVREKSSNLIPVSLQFDHRDRLGGGGITYGLVSLIHGSLNLDDAGRALDAATARTDGAFNKLTLDVARIQSLFGNFSVYGRYSAQWASKNLDASEKFNLGGYYGVRSYSLGEGSGDKGWLAQLELRYDLGGITPFAFYDTGSSSANVDPWDAASSSTRKIAGPGFGVRSLFGKWSADATISWRSTGGKATADDKDRDPRIFFMLARRL